MPGFLPVKRPSGLPSPARVLDRTTFDDFSRPVLNMFSLFSIMYVDFGGKNDDIRTTFGRHTDDTPTTFGRHSDDTPTTFGRLGDD